MERSILDKNIQKQFSVSTYVPNTDRNHNEDNRKNKNEIRNI